MTDAGGATSRSSPERDQIGSGVWFRLDQSILRWRRTRDVQSLLLSTSGAALLAAFAVTPRPSDLVAASLVGLSAVLASATAAALTLPVATVSAAAAARSDGDSTDGTTDLGPVDTNPDDVVHLDAQHLAILNDETARADDRRTAHAERLERRGAQVLGFSGILAGLAAATYARSEGNGVTGALLLANLVIALGAMTCGSACWRITRRPYLADADWLQERAYGDLAHERPQLLSEEIVSLRAEAARLDRPMVEAKAAWARLSMPLLLCQFITLLAVVAAEPWIAA